MSLIVGIDVGGTKMLGGIVTMGGQPLASQQVQTRPESYMTDLKALAGATFAKAKALDENVVGIGVGTTGLVNHAEGNLRRSINLGLSEFPIRPLLEEAFGVPAYVDNDIHAAALGELMFGAGRTYSDFLLVNAGTGIAVGLVFGGSLYRGTTNVAGEFGHSSIDFAGKACSCGLPGCVEFNLLRARKGELTQGVEFPRFREPPPSPEYSFLALGIINLVNLLNPAAVVLAGGMFTGNEAGASWVAEAVRRESLDAATEGLQHVGVSDHGPSIGLIGAAALVLEGMKAEPGKGVPHA